MIDNRYGIVYQTQENFQFFSILSKAGIYFQAYGFGAGISVFNYIPRYLFYSYQGVASPITLKSDLFYQFHFENFSMMPTFRSEVDISGRYVFEPGFYFFGNQKFPFLGGVSYNTDQYLGSILGYNIRDKYRQIRAEL